MLAKLLAVFWIVICSSLEAFCNGDEAVLLITKEISSKVVAEEQEVDIEYTIYNVGFKVARNVVLFDDDLRPPKLLLKDGVSQFDVEDIPPKTNLTRRISPIVLKEGALVFNSAIVHYEGKTGKIQTSHSTEPGRVKVLGLKEYKQKHESRAKEWLLFSLIATPMILVPFLLWWRSSRKYEKMGKNAKSRKRQ